MKKYQGSILIVDDTPTNIRVLFDLLDKEGFQVAIAKSGENALEKVQELLPDLILLDVMMPGIDGFETCCRLKANGKTKGIPIIFMTALSDPVDKVRGLNLGAVDYIAKPIHLEETLARVNVHLKLRKAQMDLLQKEKMTSLGKVVAGVAHEINNPVNFIHGNLPHAQKYIHNLLRLIELYKKHHPQPIPEINAFLSEIDLAFLQQDLTKLFSSMKFGSERIRKIVESLKLFAHLDESEWKETSIHDGIESTLLLLNNRLQANSFRPEIQIIRQYEDLPLIPSYAGQLNQVFINLLSNAVDAIDDKFHVFNAVPITKDIHSTLTQETRQPHLSDYSSNPFIQITTQLNSNSTAITITITDNGAGISESVLPRIFEQFFTTKPIGRGTGLGLSVCYQIIVDRHQGQLTCHSTPGRGSEFTIELPLQPKPAFPTIAPPTQEITADSISRA
ncbi:MAG: response regulator [Oculatellaceae cyanobacterium Prado106]|jgi:signal transduction histidine kinase|nr:response regulator [Oculatellaceae cyanobacterium Prado106]